MRDLVCSEPLGHALTGHDPQRVDVRAHATEVSFSPLSCERRSCLGNNHGFPIHEQSFPAGGFSETGRERGHVPHGEERDEQQAPTAAALEHGDRGHVRADSRRRVPSDVPQRELPCDMGNARINIFRKVAGLVKPET